MALIRRPVAGAVPTVPASGPVVNTPAFTQPGDVNEPPAAPVTIEATVEHPAVPEPAVGREIAVRQQTAITTSAAPVVNPFAVLADEGFEGLEDDGGLVFPVISLQNDARFADNDKNDLGTELFVRIYGSKKKFVFRGLTGDKVKDNKTDVAYSYDGVTTSRGRTIEDVQAQWKAEGKALDDPKTYLDVNAQLYAPGDASDGDYVVLSIPPASIRRFKQYAATTRMKTGQPLGDVVTKITAGPKVTQGVPQSFYPWSFSVA